MDAEANEGNSDNKAISEQLGWGLTELGNILRMYSQIWHKHVFKYAVHISENIVQSCIQTGCKHVFKQVTILQICSKSIFRQSL